MSYRRRRAHPGRSKLNRVNPRSRIRSYVGSDKDDYIIIAKIVLTIIILFSVLIVRGIDRPLPQKIVNGIRTAITQDFDIKESIGQLKFVKKYSPEIKSVFGTDEDISSPLIMPAQGEIVKGFDAVEGFDLQGLDTMEIKAMADGGVLLIDEHDRGYAITIRHSEDLVTVYHNITRPYVKKGEEVSQGDLIGIIEGKPDKKPLLHFKVWKDDRPIDPNSLLQQLE